MKITNGIQFMFLLIFLAGCSGTKSAPTLEPFATNSIPVLNPVSTNFEIEDCSALNNQQSDQPNPPQDDERDDENDGGNTHCGYLTVLEDRRLPDGPKIKIAVTIFISSSTNYQPDPLVIVGGGFSLGRGRYFGSPGMYGEIASDRDIIMFDIRGMGHSQPAFSCAEYSELSSRMISENMSMMQWQDEYIEASCTCREQLKGAGVNSSAYTSAAVAADLEELRQVLGYTQWNVYASSYGTRIALALMRNFPQSLRSVVLDSPWPLQVDPFAEQALHAEQALNTHFRYCMEDEQCNQYYPLLKDCFYENIDALKLGQSTSFNRFYGGVEQLILCNDLAGFSSLNAITSGSAKVDIGIQKYTGIDLIPDLVRVF